MIGKERNGTKDSKAAVRTPALPVPFHTDAMLRATLVLLNSENQALVQLSRTGQILSQTSAAKRLLRIRTKESIFPRLSPGSAETLRTALENGEAATFSDSFGFPQRIDAKIQPAGDVAVLLFTPQQKQSLLDVRVYQSARNALQGTLTAIHPIGAASTSRYEALIHDGPLMERMQSESPAVYATLRATANKLYNDLTDEDKEYHDLAVKSMLKLVRTVSHAEWLQASDAADAAPIFITGDLAAMCRSGIRAFCAETSRQVEFRSPHKLEAVYDPDWIMTALLNLLTNVESTADIVVTLHKGKEMVQLSVEDDGPGLQKPLEELCDAWKQDARLDFLETANGPGLGLPVVKLIAEQHGGSLTYQKKENSCVFRIAFPHSLPEEDPEVRSSMLPERGFSTTEIELSVV